jgi:hypothetical protein
MRAILREPKLAALCDEVIVLEIGRLIERGPPADVLL